MSEPGYKVGDTDGKRIYLHIIDYETKEFSGLTTYHGLVRIYNSNTWPSRIFWCVVVLSCLFLFMIHSGFLLLGYHAKPTLFQVNVIVPHEGLLLPEITLCSYTPVLKTKLQGWNMSGQVLDYVLMSYTDEIDERENKRLRRQENMYKDYITKYRKNTGKEFDLRDFFMQTGPDCKDLVLECSFAGESLTDCCSIAETILTDFGKCVRFSNRDTQRRQWFSGEPFGWQFLLDSRSTDRPDNLPRDFSDMGVKVLTHEESEFPAMRIHGISVPPGTTLFAGIDVKNVTLLPRHDWGLCQPDWDPAIHGVLMVPFNYSATHCEFNCIMQRTLRECGCVPLSRALSDQAPLCTALQIQECVSNMSVSTPCECDVKCDVVEYDIQMSYANLARRHLRSDVAQRGVTEEYLEDNLVLVNIYVREISYERHEQQKQLQTADLLSNIAGSMGLFLGMSTVTLLEIFIYLFKSVWGTINSERQKQFEEAMIEEENEQKKEGMLFFEEEIDVDDDQAEPAPPSGEGEQGPSLAPPPVKRKMSRRISIVPIVHSHRRGSGHRAFLAEEPIIVPGSPGVTSRPRFSLVPTTSADNERLTKKRASVHTSDRVAETLEVPGKKRSISTPRRSVIHLDGVGDLNSSRRPSFLPLPTDGMSGVRRYSAQPGFDPSHLMATTNSHRRRSSVLGHIKHDFLDF